MNWIIHKEGLLTLLLTILACDQAFAGILLTAEEVGNDVIISGGGSIDLTGLIPGPERTPEKKRGLSIASNAVLIGVTADGRLERYRVTGPRSFGTVRVAEMDIQSLVGDSIRIFGNNGNLELPADYVSNAPFSFSGTFRNRNFMGLGYSEGTYTWTFANQETVTLQIGNPTNVVPEPITASLFGFGLLGCVVLSRRWRENE